jgi:hypothetical protein
MSMSPDTGRTPSRTLMFEGEPIPLPPDETVKAVFQRLVGPDGKGGTKAMDWQTVGRYGRHGKFRGVYHDERERLPL